MRIRKLIYSLLLICVALFGAAVFAACKGADRSEGPETGVYYYDAQDGEYLITLNSGNSFTFLVMGENKSGEYTLEGEALTLRFFKEDDGSLSATCANDVISLSYQGADLRFLKKIPYTVQFDSNGGSAVESASVINGRRVQKPADPTRDGYTFIGWYEDAEFTKPFLFDSRTVSSDLVLYAQWGQSVFGQSEFTVDFDLGYAGAENTPEAVRTVGGQVYALPADPAREGYTFCGWWVSMLDDAEKLSYPYERGMVLKENTTLHALWQENTTGSKLSVPVVRVSATAISWEGILNVSTYQLSVKGPDGYSVEKTVGATTETMDFASMPAGDYEITVTAISTAGAANNSEPAVRSYRNKALDRVSLFTVIEPCALVFNEVDGAQKYYISIDCGDEYHQHEMFDNGNSTYFNFTNCAMQPGGIRFTVTATADGYASSVSREFVYDRLLGKVTGLHVDEDSGMLVWDAVPNAMSYVLTVKCGDASHQHEKVNVGNRTSYSLKECAPAAGGITVEIYPMTKGYNSPEPSVLTYDKSVIATPRDVRLHDMTLSWQQVQGATGYEVRVGDKVFSATGTELDLSGVDFSFVTMQDYTIAVRATGSSTSYWSSDLDARYLALYSGMHYAGSVLTWRHVLGADWYEVKLNDNEAVRVDDGSNGISIVPERAGENVISIRFYDAIGGYSQWVDYSVIAYTISFDAREGEPVDPVYRAIGDAVGELPTTNRLGYTFSGWYNTPGGADSNGALYSDEYYNEAGDLLLYAFWTPAPFKAYYDADENMPVEFSQVYYRRNFTLEIPAETMKGAASFSGWYTEPNGHGTKLTDENGVSVGIWSLPQDMTVYAYWADTLSYTMLGDGTWSVTKGAGIGLVTTVTVPAQYEGIDVTVVDGYAFQSCSKLITINIPNSIKTIETRTAFSSCYALQAVNIYPVPGYNPSAALYSSQDGVLLYNDPITHSVNLQFVPESFSGAFTIPSGVQTIPLRLFADSDITSVTIPNTVTSIEQNAFYWCTSLRSVYFEPDADDSAGTLTIADRAFYYCSNLTEITLPSRVGEMNLEKLGTDDTSTNYDSVFYGCSLLTAINVQDGGSTYASVDGMLTDASKSKIVWCPAGKTGTVTIPTGITSIGERAFFLRKKITRIEISNQISEIGPYAFYGYQSYDAPIVREIVFKGGSAPRPLTVDEYAFYGYSSLTKITFEEGSCLNVVKPFAFGRLSALSTLTLPNTIGRIEENGFADCTALVRLDFEEGDQTSTTIETSAFSGCTALVRVDLPSYVGEIENGAFNNCVALTGVYVDENNQRYADKDGVLYSHDFDEILFFPRGKGGDYELPDTIARVGDGVFEGNINIRSIHFSENIEYIGNNAFRSCSNLTSVTFEEGGDADLSFGSYAFAYCSSLTEFHFPERTVDTGTYTFYNASRLAQATLPATTETIGEYTFYGTAITEMTIPDSVTEIGSYAFYNTGLTDLEIGSNVSTIGDYAFYGIAITELTVPLSLENLGTNAFANCGLLATLTFENGIKVIPAHSFANCSSLVRVNIPGSVEVIGNAAFLGCTALKEVEFATGDAELHIGEESPVEGNSYTTIELLGVFQNCTALTTFAVPERATYLGPFIFYGCTQLTNIELSDSIETIERHAFHNCTKLSSIDLPEDLATIGAYAFSASGLNQVTIPQNVTSIEVGAFSQSSALKEVTFAEGGSEPLLLGAGNSGSYSYSSGAFASDIGLTTVSLPARLQLIGKYSFYGCSQLKDVEFAKDSQLTTIEGNAFYNCSALQSITLPNSLKNVTNDSGAVTIALGTYAFENCTSLQTVVFEGGGTEPITLGNYLFQGCAKLEEVTLPARLADETSGSTVVPAIGADVFDGCNALKEFKVSEGQGSYSAKDGILYAENESVLVRCPTAKEGKVTIPNTVSRISSRAFYYCEKLTDIEFASGNDGNKLYIGSVSTSSSSSSYSFEYCTKITKIVLPDRLAKFEGSYAFAYCTALTEVTIPNSTENIGGYCFAYCSALKTVTFKSGNTSTPLEIGSYAFRSCPIETLELPERTTAIGSSAFEECRKLTTVNLPGTLESIGSYAFETCTALKTVTVGANSQLKSLGTSAFESCGSLTEFTLPGSLTSFGEKVFSGCGKLRKLSFAQDVGGVDGTLFVGAAIEELDVPSNARYLSVKDNVLYNKDGTRLIYYPAGKTGDDFTVDDKVTQIGAYAFYRQAHLKTITVSGSVLSVAEYAFSACPMLEKVTFLNGRSGSELRFILEHSDGYNDDLYIFGDSNRLSSVTLPSHMTAIEGSRAFSRTPALKTLTIPERVQSLGVETFVESGITDLILSDGITEFADNLWGMFENCTSLEHVKLPAGLTSLPRYTFSGCTSLQSVDMPSALISIGYDAFKDCSSLTSIEIPDGVTTIGYSAFEGCSSLTEVILPDTVTSLGYNTYDSSGEAFADCTSLESVKLSSLLTEIRYRTFSGCYNLASIEIPEGVTKIGDYAFGLYSSYGVENPQGLIKLTEIKFPSTLTEIGQYAFYQSGLKSVDLGQNITTVGYDAFAECPDLTEVKIGAALTNYERAFRNNVSLTTVEFDSAATTVSASAFDGCTALEEAVIPATVTAVGASAYANSGLQSVTFEGADTTIGASAFAGCASLTSVNLPTSIVEVSANAFDGCTSLGEITLPDQLQRIGASAFRGTALNAITIPGPVASIGASAFENCEKLASVEMTFGLSEIGDSAFKNCKALASFNLPASLSRLGDVNPFEGCTSLTAFTGEQGGAFFVDENGVIYDSSRTTLVCYPAGKQGAFTIPEYVSRIGSYAFAGSSITVVTLPQELTSVADYAFYNCANLIEAALPDGLTSIGNYSFAGSGLKTVKISDAVTSIGLHAFENCKSLTSLTFEEGGSQTLTIQDYAFAGTGLTAVKLPETVLAIPAYCFQDAENLATVTLHEGIATIGSYAFAGTGLTGDITIENYISSVGTRAYERTPHLNSLTIKEGAGSIGNYLLSESGVKSVTIEAGLASLPQYMFNETEYLTQINVDPSYLTLPEYFYYGAKGLKSVTLPVAMTEIPYSMFRGAGLEHFEIPSQITDIEGYAFYGMPNLKEITIPASVSYIGYYAFRGCESLTTVTVEEGVTGFSGSYLFADCQNLKTVKLPSTVATFSMDMFANSGLEEFDFSFNNNITRLGSYLFEDCAQLRKVILPTSLTELGSYLFYNCSSLREVEVPETVQTIGSSAFRNCTSLKELVIYNAGDLLVDGNAFSGWGPDQHIYFVGASGVGSGWSSNWQEGCQAQIHWNEEPSHS